MPRWFFGFRLPSLYMHSTVGHAAGRSELAEPLNEDIGPADAAFPFVGEAEEVLHNGGCVLRWGQGALDLPPRVWAHMCGSP